ncbi:MAG: hypothetical protein QXE10_01670 [Desulfurococcaceae archaeon]
MPRDVGLTWKPKRECFEKRAGMQGFPHSNDSEKTMKGELWAEFTPRGGSR